MLPMNTKRPRLGGAHAGQERARQHERRAQVHVQLLVPRRHRRVLDAGAHHHARVVHDDAAARPARRRRAAAALLERGRVLKSAKTSNGICRRRCEQRRRLPRVAATAGRAAPVEPRLAKRERDGAPHATARARDQRHAAQPARLVGAHGPSASASSAASSSPRRAVVTQLRAGLARAARHQATVHQAHLAVRGARAAVLDQRLHHALADRLLQAQAPRVSVRPAPPTLPKPNKRAPGRYTTLATPFESSRWCGQIVLTAMPRQRDQPLSLLSDDGLAFARAAPSRRRRSR